MVTVVLSRLARPAAIAPALLTRRQTDGGCVSSPLAVRQANDILMGIERSFLDPRGLPDRPDYK